MRIMVAASTDMFSFVPIRAVSRVRTEPNKRDPTVTQTRNEAVPSRTRKLPDASTSENSRLFSHGVSIPIPVTASMANASITRSDGAICWTMYFIRLPALIFARGKGL